MSSPVITPAPVAPVAPAPVVAPNPAPIIVTEHTRLDSVQNRIAAKLAAAREAPHPMPGLPNQPVQAPLASAPAAAPLTPPVPGAPATPAVVAPAQNLPPESPAELDLSALDFDAAPKPDTPDPVEAAPGTPAEAAPASTETDSAREIAEALARGDVPEKVEEVFLRSPRGRQMLTSFKTLRDLAQPPEKGGIGRVPTTDEIKESDASHRQLTALRFDADTNPASVAHNLFIVNAETGQTFLGDPEKAISVLQAIPQAIFEAAKQTQSPVYANMLSALSLPMFENFFNYQYSQAFLMPEESPQQLAQYKAANQTPPMLDDKIRMLDALQISEFKAFGRARPMNWTPGNIAPPQNGNQAPDPEKAQLLERLRQADAIIAQGRQTQLGSIVQNVESASKSAAMADIDKALAFVNVSKVYPASVIQSQKNDIYNELKSALPTQDPSGWQRYTIQLQQASRGQASPESVAKTFQQLFQNALRHSPQVRERLNDLVKGAKSHVDAQHAMRSQSQYRTETNGAGVPAPASVLPGQQIARQSGESIEDYNTRRILAASQRGTQPQPR